MSALLTVTVTLPSLIIFRGLNISNLVNALSLVIGFITTPIGMHLLELSRKPAVTGHRTLENGILNPWLFKAQLWAHTAVQLTLFNAFKDLPNGSAHEDGEDDKLEAATERMHTSH
ncbi:hypothetical protein BJV78DRAFT_1282169 [Lactifluus subvellereus]|nr:hypothetical protein BJV78DRAFT_1282169 [Lactifluus subvellereus]